MFEELNQILWILRTDGSVRRFNPAWIAYTGLPAVTDGLSWAEVFHPNDRQRILAVRTAGEPYEVEARMRRADGVYRRHLCRVKPLRRDGAIHAWLGTAIDVEDARASEERQRALVELSDHLRDIDDPKEIAWAGAAAVGRSLGLVRAGYAIVDGDTAIIERDWVSSPEQRSSIGSYRISEWGAYLAPLSRNQTVTVDDVETDPQTAEAKDGWLAWGIRAVAFVPLMRDGRLVAYMFLHSESRRSWTAEETDFIRNVSDRIWTAIWRNRATRDLVESEARFRAVQETSIDGFMMLEAVRDDQGQLVDFRWIYANEAAEQIIGKPRTWFVGRRLLEEMPSNRDEGLFDAYAGVVVSGRPWVSEITYRHEEVNVHIRLAAAKAGDGFAVTFSDLSERQRVEERLRESEAAARRTSALLDLLVETAPDPIWTKDEQGRFVLVNSAAARVIGRPREELTGLRNSDLLPADLAAFYDSEDERVLKQAAIVDVEETVHDHTRAELRTYLSTKVPLRSSSGSVIGILGIARDITERKAIEARLRESSERVQLALDAGAIVGTWVWDVPADRFTADERFACSFGLDAELCRSGLPLEKVMTSIHEDDRSRVAAAVAEALGRGGPYHCEYRVRQDGTFRWIEANGRVELGGDGQPLRFPGVLLDIEERRAAEAERDRAVRLLHTFIEAVPGVVYAKDREGRMLMANRGTTELIGKSPEEYLGKTDAEFLDDKGQAEIVMANDRRIMESGEPHQVEEDVRLSNGSPATWLSTKAPLRNEAGEVIGLIGTSIDISERKRIEAALWASEEKLRGLNETLEHRVAETTAERDRVWRNSRDLLAVMGFDGYLKAINPAWEATLGFDEATLLALPFWEQVHPDDHAAVGALVERLRNGEAIARFEDRLRHADGSWRWIAWSLVPEGEVFYASGRDVTAEKVAAIELEQVQEALRQSQKLESMGQLTGGVAHDFNNLLMPIIGGLDMLQRRITDERSRRLIDGALQSAERAKTLVQRLLAFARRQPLQPTSVDLPQLVEGMADLVASTSGPRVKVVVDVNPELPPVKADPNQLEMAILNLAVNARDAMPDGGQLTIAARDEILGSRHRSKLPVGHYVRLSVSDTGIGMDEATLARAIEPFFSTKGIGKGTGLGLSMAHGLAAQLGGALTIQSKPGVGTSVELWLPVALARAQREEGAQDVVRISAVGTALLIDDEDIVRASTADMLAEIGYAVIETSSAEEALELLDGGLVPDVVITDHLMPGMTGADLARVLRERRHGIPVLIISGYAEDDGIAPDLPRLTKPFRQGELATSLAKLTTVPAR
jgi:PAS domain S-box-containing protein